MNMRLIVDPIDVHYALEYPVLTDEELRFVGQERGIQGSQCDVDVITPRSPTGPRFAIQGNSFDLPEGPFSKGSLHFSRLDRTYMAALNLQLHDDISEIPGLSEELASRFGCKWFPTQRGERFGGYILDSSVCERKAEFLIGQTRDVLYVVMGSSGLVPRLFYGPDNARSSAEVQPKGFVEDVTAFENVANEFLNASFVAAFQDSAKGCEGRISEVYRGFVLTTHI